MPPEAALSERRQQIFERLEPEEIERLVGDFKPRLDVRLVLADLSARRFAKVAESLAPTAAA